MKIAIIEEEEILVRVLKEKFESSGFEVAVAIDGNEAIPVIRSAKPDIILLDLLLPKRDGFAVLDDLKADPKLKNIPVCILSNLGQDEAVVRALKSGADDYLIKAQHSIDDVVKKVRAIIASKGK